MVESVFGLNQAVLKYPRPNCLLRGLVIIDVPAIVRSVVNLLVNRWVSMEEMNTNLSIFGKYPVYFLSTKVV